MKPDSALCDDPAGVSFGKPQGVNDVNEMVQGRARITRTVLLEPALVRNAGLSGAHLKHEVSGDYGIL